MERKIIKLYQGLLAACILCLGLAGCNFGSAANSPASEKAYLSVNNVARAISVEDVEVNDIKKAELYYKENGSQSNFTLLKTWQTEEDEENAITLMQAERNLYVNAGTYNFKLDLYLYKDDDYLLCQSGSLTQTVNPGNNTLNFDTTYISDGSGDLSVDFSWAEDTGISKIDVALYELDDNLSEASTASYTATIFEASDENELTEASYNEVSIPAGYYTMKVELYDSDNIKLNTFDDTIHIVSGCRSSGTWALTNINTRYILTLVVNRNAEWTNTNRESGKYNSSTRITLPTKDDLSLQFYELVKWIAEDGREYEPGAEIGTITGNTVFYAQWVRNYTVTVINADDEQEIIVHKNAVIEGVEAEPVRNGYTFFGWITTSGSDFNLNTPITNNITIIADWMQGQGTEDNPYLLASVDDWNRLARLIDKGNTFENKYFKLTADIGSTENPVTEMLGKYSTASGAANKIFAGVFDGNGKTVTVAYNSKTEYTAPFAYVSGATIKNLNIAGSIKSSAGYMAGLIARVDRSVGNAYTVENCIVSASLTTSYASSSYLGGFISSVYDGTEINLTKCAFTGKLLGSGATYVSGFIAFISDNVVRNLTDCIFAPSQVTVSHSSSYTLSVYDNTQNYCQNLSISGGFYYTLQLGSLPYDTTLLVYSVCSEGPLTNPSVLCKNTPVEITILGKTFYLYERTDITFTNYYSYDGSTPIEPSYTVKLGTTAISSDGNYTTRITDLSGNEVTTIESQGQYIFEITGTGDYFGSASYTFSVWQMAGEGTVDEPYLINNKSDWNYFAKAVASGTNFAGKYLKLTADIGSANDPVTEMIGVDSDHAFFGVFDGNGKAITVDYDTNIKYTAPFHYIKQATIKNLIIEGSIRSSNNYTAGLVGWANSVSTLYVYVQNCKVNANVISTYNGSQGAAGLFAYAGDLLGTMEVSNCIFTGKLIAENSYNCFGLALTGGILRLRNCIFAPSEVRVCSVDSKTLSGCSQNSYLDTSFYTTQLGAAQGTKCLISTPEEEDGLYKFNSDWTIFDETYSIYTDVNANVNASTCYDYNDGENIEITYTVQDKDGTLTEGTDYTVSIKNSDGNLVTEVTETGDYSLIIQGCGDYQGKKTLSFSVTQAYSLEGDGSQENPYLISSISDWYIFTKNIDDGETYSEQYIKLTSDIGSPDSPVTKMAGLYSSAASSRRAFAGTFDGNGKVITVDFSNAGAYAALFSYVSGGRIKNVTVAGKLVSSASYKGGIIGYSEGTVNIESSLVTAVVGNGSYTGGFAGENKGTLNISDCIFAGEITSTNYSGGFVGKNNNYCTVNLTNCFFAPVEIPYPNPNNCYIFVYNSGSCSCNNCYYTIIYGNRQYEASNSVYKTASAIPSGLICEKKTFTNSLGTLTYYVPVSLTQVGLKQVYYTGSEINPCKDVTIGSRVLTKDQDYNFQIKDANGNPVSEISQIGDYTITFNFTGNFFGTYSYSFKVFNPFEGSGSEEDPYLIQDIADWETFAYLVQSGGKNFSGEYLKMTVNIGSASMPVTEMIGNSSNAFYGTFDGNNKIITVAYNTDISGTAVFSYVREGAVKNLTVAGSIQSTRKYLAGLIGFTYNAVVENCTVKAELISTYSQDLSTNMGGFIGDSKKNLTMKNCAFTGKFLGENVGQSGGFIGYLEDEYVTVENCFFLPEEITVPVGDAERDCYFFGTPDTSVTENYLMRTAYLGSVRTLLTTVSFNKMQNALLINSEPGNDDVYEKITLLGKDYYYKGSLNSSSSYSSLYDYTGSEIELQGTLSCTYYNRYYSTSQRNLVENTDYVIEIRNSDNEVVTQIVDLGQYKFVAKGIGNYSGEKQLSTFEVIPPFSGSGTEEDPYLLTNDQDWHYFVVKMRATNEYQEAHTFFKLTADIGSTESPVTEYAGYSSLLPFRGTLDGNGKTLTVNINERGMYIAPFRYATDAKIKNLTVAGNIQGSNYYMAGLIGYAFFEKGNVEIENCISKTQLTYTGSSYSYSAGFVGYVYGTQKDLIIKDSRFAGSTTNSIFDFNGFVGYGPSSNNIYIDNCLFVPESTARNPKSPFSLYGNNYSPVITSCYYSGNVTNSQGTRIYASDQADSLPQGKLYTLGSLADCDWYIPCTINYKSNDVIAALTGDIISSVEVTSYSGEKLTKNVDYSVECEGSGTADSPYQLTLTGLGAVKGSMIIENLQVASTEGDN